MLFCPTKKQENPPISIFIEGQPIEVLKETKFLGIILDNKLSWKPHIAYTTKKLSKSLGILSRARKFLNQDILKQLYYSFAYPYLIYCIVIWGHAPAASLWPLFRAQKRAIRIISNTKRRESTQPSSKKLRILRLPELYTFAVLIFMFKFKHGSLPAIFNNFYRKIVLSTTTQPEGHPI